MQRGIDDVEQQCLECGRQCSNRRSLGNHVARSHPEVGGLLGYVLAHFLQGRPPACSCGCGQPVAWHKTQYTFNVYVNGHNEAGFKVKQPDWTPEQLDRRNEAIRKAYAERGDEIGAKIGAAVKLGLAKSEFDFGSLRKRLWQDPDFKDKQHASRLASWSGAAGDARRKKVFVPEFGRKIGLANMRRDARQTSETERQFVDHLRSILGAGDVQASKWFNFTERTWCADAWLVAEGYIVEFDGAYWHGLDRSSDFTCDQLATLANDVRKNELARRRGLSLLRVSEAADWRSARTFDQLVELAHHHVRHGTVIKEGTFLAGEDAPLVSREALLRDSSLAPRLLPLLADLLRAQVAYHGWFYPPSDEPVERVLEGISSHATWDAQGLATATTGSSWLKSRAKAYWDVDGGPVAQFDDDKALAAVLSYRLGLNNSMPYSYTLSDGTVVSAHETFNITLKNVRRGFVVQRRGVSWFLPTRACAIYRQFLQGVERPMVWDPSIGFGARMLGFAAACDVGAYVGTDPAPAMYADARALAAELRSVRPNAVFDLRRQGSETFEPEPETLDMVFTSPPYFDVEKYYDQPGQCWRDFPTLELWTKRYLVPTFERAFLGLKPGAPLVINASADIEPIVVQAALAVGLQQCPGEETTLVLKQDHFAKKRGSPRRPAEPVLVFRKPC